MHSKRERWKKKVTDEHERIIIIIKKKKKKSKERGKRKRKREKHDKKIAKNEKRCNLKILQSVESVYFIFDVKSDSNRRHRLNGPISTLLWK